MTMFGVGEVIAGAGSSCVGAGSTVTVAVLEAWRPAIAAESVYVRVPVGRTMVLPLDAAKALPSRLSVLPEKVFHERVVDPPAVIVEGCATNAPISGSIVCITAGDMLDANSASPEYSAVSTCVPMLSPDVVRAALPASSPCVPSTAAPFLKVTVPVGVPVAAVTRATSVTAWPPADGFEGDASDVSVDRFITTWTKAGAVLDSN